jgi:hypothetical protein
MYGAVVYPNPARDRATLAFESAESGTGYVRVMDLTGRSVWSTSTGVEEGDNSIIISFGDAPAAGIYLVELRVGSNVERVRVVVE